MPEQKSEFAWVETAFGAVALIVAVPFLMVVGVMGLFRDPKAEREKRELKETRALYDRVLAKQASSPITEDALDNLPVSVIVEACRTTGRLPGTDILDLLLDLVNELIADEGLSPLPEIDWSRPLSMETGAGLRNHLRARMQYLENFDVLFVQWRGAVVEMLVHIIKYLPAAAVDDDEDNDTNPGLSASLDVSLIDLVGNPAAMVEDISAAAVVGFDDDRWPLGPLRDRIELNACRASGISPEQRETTRKPYILPSEQRGQTAHELAAAYLGGTPFERLLLYPMSFNIPDAVRFEHCHIVGGTGHGKTQLLQLLIHQDLLRAREDKRSIIVIDSQGDLANTTTHLTLFDPGTRDSLADRLVVVDPHDVEYPVRLNMFDFDRGRLNAYGPAQREMILSGTVALFEYMFGALLGSELTEKQGVIFKFLARLMMVIPGATIHTLRDVMENGEKYRPYFAQLDGTTRHFFETQFLQKTFDPTKQQIARRLWSILSYPTLERVFSHEENAVDLFEMMNAGKIVVINTAKDLLKEDGSQVLGRFFIALIGQAALERAALPAVDRRPCFVYVDEAHEYFDERVEDLLNQARKFKVGLTLAHQNLDQLSTRLRATFMASTSIKLAGGVSSKDARAFAEDMRCEAEFIRSMRKHEASSDFACFIKNALPRAIRVSVPLGAIDAEPAMPDDAYHDLLAGNRTKYCRHMDEVSLPVELPAPTMPSTVRPEPVKAKEPVPATTQTISPQTSPSIDRPKVEPKPDRQHVYLQNLLRKVAQDRGFKVTLEEPILDGSGRVDIALADGDQRIACEITVTTTPEHELGNVLKCLAAGYDKVLVVSSAERHLKSVEKHVSANLSTEQSDQVLFLSPDAAIECIDGLGSAPAGSRKLRGYNVTVTKKAVSSADAQARQTTVNKLIADSVRRMKPTDKPGSC